MKCKYYLLYILVTIFFINCQSLPHQRDKDILDIKKVNINPAEIKDNGTYEELLLMDKNLDGIINQYDFSENVIFTNFKDVLYSYSEYLNNFQKYDYQFSIYLDLDLNKNNKIDKFEYKLDSFKKEGKIEEFLELIKVKYNSHDISEYQMLVAEFILYNYIGDLKKLKESANEIKDNYPDSNFSLFKCCECTKSYNHYNYSKKDTRYLISSILADTILKDIHKNPDSLKLIKDNMNKLFPYLFIDRIFMLKFVSKIQFDLYEDITAFTKEKKENEDKEKVKELNKKIDSRNKAFDNLDVFYAYITKLDGYHSYNTDIVIRYKTKLNIFIKNNKDIKIKNYNDALAFIKRYISGNKVPEYQYHYLVSALFNLLISNRKPLKEGDLLLSPDQLFSKGYGVCADQSLVLSVILNDLFKIKDTNLYLWFRKAYWNHLSMIYKNVDGNFFILDNFGINRFFYISSVDAIQAHCKYSIKYIPSLSLKKANMDNKSWDKVEKGIKKNITTDDGAYTIIFDKEVTCE